MQNNKSKRNTDFQLMFKPICGRCNLDCVYCYYKDKHHSLYPDQFPMMSYETLERSISEYLSIKDKVAEFSWQGGEPLLAGKDFFYKVVEYQSQYGKSGCIIGNAIQTNGVLLDDEWCRFFREYRFLVGISIDGPEKIHNYYRKGKNGEESFRKVYSGLNLLKSYGVEFNVLVTLNAKNVSYGADIYRFLVNSGVRFIQFIPILEWTKDGKIAEFSCPADGYGKFMVDVFKIWAKRDIGRVSVRLFDSVLSYLIRGQASLCWNLPSCPKAFIVEWNGDFYVCDHFVERKWFMGNIHTSPLVELARSKVFDEFSNLKRNLPSECSSCKYLPLCNGGCPKHHISIDGHGKVNYFCPSYKFFFSQTLMGFKKIANSIHN